MSGASWRSAAMAAAVAVLIASCANDSGDSISAPPTTEQREQGTTTTETTTPTTVADTSTTSEPDPTTTSTSTTVTDTTEVPDLPYWSEACTELAGDAAASYVSDGDAETFTTLGAAPTLDLVIPEVVTSEGPYGSIAATVPVPGGFLVGIYPPDGWPVANEILYSSSLVAVDHDGTIRWRRCFGDDVPTRKFAVAPAALEPDVAWVVSEPWNASMRILGVDLRTGADIEFPLDVSTLGERGGGGRYLVLGPPIWSDDPVAADDRLTVVDLVDASVATVPVPPSWFGVQGGWLQIIDTDPSDDEYVLADRVPGPRESAALYVGGSWTDDAAVQREVLPLQVTESFAEPFELQLYDGAAELVWSVPDFHGIGREGFNWTVTEDVVLASRCTGWSAESGCGWVGDQPPEDELVGFELATGRELWSLPGYRAVPVIAGHVAIVSDTRGEHGSLDDGYVLVDLLTGERIGPDGDPWPSGAFAQECCGGDVYVNVQRHGGVVVATNMEHVRVWYPPELTAPTVTVDLMR